MDWGALRELRFEPVAHERFAAVDLAHRVMEAGGTAGAVLNAANEAAVEAFLAGRIGLPRIQRLVAGALDAIPPAPVHTMDDVGAADEAARRFVEQAVSRAAATAV